MPDHHEPPGITVEHCSEGQRLHALLVGVGVLMVWAVACADDPMRPTPGPLNRSPTLTTAIPAQTISVGEATEIDLSNHFSDPDGDALTFAVETQDPSVATVAVAGGTLTLAAVGQGTTGITVTARDPGDLSATQTFAVTVPSRPPALTDSIPALQLIPSDSAFIDLSDHFRDPDGDTLSFAVEVSDTTVVSASVSADTLAVVAIRPGKVSIAVTARDPDGLTASQQIDVMVSNRAPILTDSIAALEVFTFDTVKINLLAHFSDPDGDTLSFAAETSNREVAAVSLSGHTAAIMAAGHGTAEITFTGTDPGALTASQTVAVIVPNRQPTVTEPIPRQPLLSGEVATIDLLAHFDDPDGDDLEFAAVSSDGTIASASTSDTQVTVTSVGPGAAEITVVAHDPGDLSTAQSFVVNVSANADKDALIALFEATEGPNWDWKDNWLTSAPLRAWAGVSVNAEGRVTRLQLAGNGLAGLIPPELGWLTELSDLDLSGNYLKGGIPPELARIHGLKELNLRDNRLTGTIPNELAKLAGLTELLLSFNALTGFIPSSLGALTELESLSLLNNRLEGPIPASLGNLAELEYLFLSTNRLTGPIPRALGRLGNLVQLGLGQNELSGALPPEFGRLQALQQLDLDGNDLTGLIPPELGQLRRLERLSLRFNRLTGPIPAELGGLAALESLALDHNLLTGPVPSELGSLRNLGVLWLHENLLTGALPASIGSLPTLWFLVTYGNDGLCIPGVTAFAVWAEKRPGDGFCSAADKAALTALYEFTGGSDWEDSEGWLGGPLLELWQGVITDSIGRVTVLDLRNNGLAGRLPSDLGSHLDRLGVLRIGDNALSGPLPSSLASLDLQEFDYAGTGLCVPPDESFKTWLDGIPVRRGPLDECPQLSDRAILVRLYEATDGENWVDQDNWLTNAPLGSWFGVSTDAQGRVTRIDLRNNGLAGRLPPELGDLSKLSDLNLRNNGLSGSIPSELGKLAELTYFTLRDNKFTGVIPPELGALSALISLNLTRNELSGGIPTTFGELSRLRDLWLSSNSLSGSIPTELGRLARLQSLSLSGNSLTGRIPAVLGDLARLDQLYLYENRLVGSIPPELGNLRALRRLGLQRNRLTGAIPSELAHLAKLDHLDLAGNGVSGPIPPELGQLTELEFLNLSGNELTGPLPPELGALSKLRLLFLSENSLTGPIPPELGGLTDAVLILLDENDLSGTLPAEFGNLTGLNWLHLSFNAGLGGPLPPTLTELRELMDLRLQGTDFCLADHPDLVKWLDGAGVGRLPPCSSRVKAYLTQAVQSRDFPVPLVAGEEALLRVFVTAKRVNRESFPPVRATFFLDGREVYRTEIADRRGTIPTRVNESSLENSANAVIPGSVVQPGVEMVIEVQPEGDLDPSLGVDRRIPKTGRTALEVADVPPMDLTLIPFFWNEQPDSTILTAVQAMAADPENHPLLWDTRTMLPVRELAVTAHEPVLSSDNDVRTLFRQTEAIQALEGGGGHYMGMLAGEHTGPRGIGRAPGKVAFSVPDPRIMAHELGHNMNLLHAPCGRPRQLDPGFREIDGSIGAWGYDFRDGRGLVDPFTSDLMSYCDPHWISDYGFTTALDHRLQSEGSAAAAFASPSQSLLLWGGVDADGNPFLDPAFVVEASPKLPGVGTEYRLEGRDADGAALFSLDFDMPILADGEGAGAFAFVLPTQPGWDGALASINLSGPAGSATLHSDTDHSTAILLDLRSGQVRGILRNLPGDPRIQADAAAGASPGRRVEILFSRGIPGTTEWQR